MISSILAVECHQTRNQPVRFCQNIKLPPCDDHMKPTSLFRMERRKDGREGGEGGKEGRNEEKERKRGYRREKRRRKKLREREREKRPEKEIDVVT